MAQPDALIIGGGVIGASIAYHLAEQGTRVTLLERGRIGGHASLASAGLLHPIYAPDVPEPLRALSAASFALYPRLVTRLHEVTGIDPQFQACGWLRVALHEDEVHALQTRSAAGTMARDYDLRLIAGDEARALEPALAPAVVAALHAPHGGQ